MGFSQRVEVVIDLVADKAKTGIRGFRDAVAEADGVTGKFKAAGSQAFSYVKDHAGELAMAGGAALVAFGVKAVHAFEDAAKAAIDLGGATGLAVEDASRWIAVGDDFGVTAEGLASGVGKIAKSLDDSKWSKYGIATRDAAGNARNANDVLIDALSTLSAITNETERTRVGNELFGRGYAQLAPLIGHTADEYREMLGSVEDGQVITAAEAKKAERMRMAEDALADALNEVQLAVGGLVAEYAPFIERTADAVGEVVALTEKVDGLASALQAGLGASSGNPIAVYDAVVSAATETVELHGKSLEEVERMLDEVGGSAEFNREIIRQWAEANGIATEETAALAAGVKHAATEVQALGHELPDTTGKQATWNEKTRDGAAAQQSVTDAIERRREEEQKLRDGVLAQIDASFAYNRQSLDTAKALEEYNAQIKAGTLEGLDLTIATDTMRQSMVGVATAFADTTGAARGSNAWISAVIGSLENQAKTLDPSSPLLPAIQGYIAELKSVPAYVETTFGIKGPGAITIEPTRNVRGGKWAGGDMAPGEWSEFAERGPEGYWDRQTGKFYVIGGAKGGQAVPLTGGGSGVTINMPGAVFNNGSDVDGFARAVTMQMAVPR